MPSGGVSAMYLDHSVSDLPGRSAARARCRISSAETFPIADDGHGSRRVFIAAEPQGLGARGPRADDVLIPSIADKPCAGCRDLQAGYGRLKDAWSRLSNTQIRAREYEEGQVCAEYLCRPPSSFLRSQRW